MTPQSLQDMRKIDHVITAQYPEQFDPKWIVMESGWPCFRLSALDNQPWKEMHKEAEALALRIADDMNFNNIQTEYFYGGKRKYKTIK